MKLSDWAKLQGLNYRTAWNYFKNNKIPNAYKLPSGTIIVQNDTSSYKDDYTITYSRVSSSLNKSNLESQSKRLNDFCLAKGWIVQDSIKEIASGLNDNRKKLNQILNNKKITRIVVEHKDILTRFGFNYIKLICDLNHVEIVIINPSNDDKEDLISDFVSIITSFCSRLYGQRRTKRNTEKLIKDLQNDKNI